jgi:hypothetical protein
VYGKKWELINRNCIPHSFISRLTPHHASS